ncbi:MAG: efflux RND transporter periplasmic adaptor subunit [Planctomycetota bacterium]
MRPRTCEIAFALCFHPLVFVASPAGEPGAGPAAHKVARGPFQVEAALDGTFEARRSYEISVASEAWSSLVVRKAVPHGARVSKGETLVAFETEEIDRAIEEEEKAVRLARLALRQAEVEAEVAERTSAMDLAAAARSAERAEEDLERFLSEGKEFSLKSAEFSLKNARNSLEYEREELRQLEKMYEADDLTEETEEIILRRQRDAVEAAEFRVEGAERSRKETFEVAVPRREIDLKEGKARGAMALERSRALAPLLKAKRRLETEKVRRETEKASEKLAKLKRDRARMEVRAPADGIVYWGRLAPGSPSDFSAYEAKLRRGGAVQPKEVFFTVLVPAPLAVRAAVPEAELHKLRGRVRGVAVPTGFPDLELPVSLERAPFVPEGRGTFSARFRVEGELGRAPVVPGMACKLKLTCYEKKSALAVPAQAVFPPRERGGSPYVFLRKPDGSIEKRDVRAGRRSGDSVEILSGIREGDEVLLEKPAEKP